MTSNTFQKIDNIFQCKLKLEDETEFTIPLREDGYIFATSLCKAVKKKVSHWLSLRETKNLVKEVENKFKKSDAVISTSGKLIEIYKGGNDKYNQGTWIHPDLGINLAQWCSPNFSLQVSKWIRELIFTNKVEIGKEKADDVILKSLQEKIKNAENLIISLENENKELNKKYHKLYDTHQYFLKKKELYKLKQGQCIYLLNMDENNTKKPIIKIGQSGDLTNRVSTYRTSNPYCKLLFVAYTNQSTLIETNMKLKYEKKLYANNSECITDVEVSTLINDIKNICCILNVEYTIESDEELENFNRNIIPLDKADEILEDIIEVDSTKFKRCGGLSHNDEKSRMISLDQFFKNKGNKDGLSRLCKECYLIGRYGDKRKRRKVVVIPKFDILTHKWCNRCENVRERTFFYNDVQSKDGISANCKSCKADQKRLSVAKKKQKKDIETVS